jgi:hypothetical protein
MIQEILNGLRRISNLGLSDRDSYCKTCGTWLKSKNDLDGHNKAFACGIANDLLNKWSKRKSLLDDKNLIDKIAQRLSMLPEQEWNDWKAKPFQVRMGMTQSTSEQYINDAIEILKIFENYNG